MIFHESHNINHCKGQITLDPEDIVAEKKCNGRDLVSNPRPPSL